MEEAELQYRSAGETQIVRFGTFDLCLRTGELRKQGVRVRLQGKPFHILKALLEEPGRVVTREELKKRLWAADTFVDFESGLNTAANRLRTALGDSAENPIYIETLARVGYRFIAPVIVSEPLQVAAAAGAGAHNGLGLVKHGSDHESVPAPARATLLMPPLTGSGPSLNIWKFAAAAFALALVLLIFAGLWTFRTSRAGTASFQQITFRKGAVEKARFTPDGRNVVFSAAWSGEPSRVFLSDAASPDPKSLGYDDAWLASVSHASLVAFFNQPEGVDHMVLQQASLAGGRSRPLSQTAYSADWAANGVLAIVTFKDSIFTVEFPAGKPVYRTTGWISDLRVSPKSNQVAFLEHPVLADDAGSVVVVDGTGHSRVLSGGWGTASGLAWNPSGREVWFTAARSGIGRSLMAVDLGGHVRQVATTPGGIHLEDVAASGKVLITRNSQRMSVALRRLNGGPAEDISRFDWSRATAITADAQSILFDESGEGGGRSYSVYVYHVAKHSFDRIGDGRSVDMSADGKWVLTQALDQDSKLTLIPMDGSPRKIVDGRGLTYRTVRFLPGGNEILFSGNYPGQPINLYRQTLPDGLPRLLFTGAPAGRVVIDASGQFAFAYTDGREATVLDLVNRTGRTLRAATGGMPVSFADAHHVLVRCKDRGFISFHLLDLDTGAMKLFQRVEDPGSDGLSPIFLAGDLNTFVCSKLQTQSDLFVVTGWS